MTGIFGCSSFDNCASFGDVRIFHNCRDELLRWPPYCSDSFSHPWLITLSLSLHSALLHYCNIAVVLASRTFPLSIIYIMLINIFIIVSISYLNIDHIIAEPSLHYCNSVVVLASRTFPLFHNLHLIIFLLWLKKWFTFIWICYCSLQIFDIIFSQIGKKVVSAYHWISYFIMTRKILLMMKQSLICNQLICNKVVGREVLGCWQRGTLQIDMCHNYDYDQWRLIWESIFMQFIRVVWLNTNWGVQDLPSQYLSSTIGQSIEQHNYQLPVSALSSLSTPSALS